MKILSLLASPQAQHLQNIVARTFENAAGSVSPLTVGANGSTVHDLERAARRVERCASSLLFSVEPGKPERLEELRTCSQHKFCPVCSDIQYSRRRNRLAAAAPVIRAAGGTYAYLLTLTLPELPGLNLVEKSALLNRAFRAWYLKGQKRIGRTMERSGGEAGKIVAAVKSVEMKRGISGAWHPHIHAVVFCREPLNYIVYKPEAAAQATLELGRDMSREGRERWKNRVRELGGEWDTMDGVAVSKLSGEWIAAAASVGVVGARSIDAKPIPFAHTEKGVKNQLSNDSGGVLGAVRYALKYAYKPAALQEAEPADVFEMWDALRGFRSVEYIGMARVDHSATEPAEPEPREPGEDREECRPRRSYWTAAKPYRIGIVDESTGEILPAPPEVKPEELEKRMRELIPEVHKACRSMEAKIVGIYRRRRREHLQRYRDGVTDAGLYIHRTEGEYGLMCDRLADVRRWWEDKAKSIAGAPVPVVAWSVFLSQIFAGDPLYDKPEPENYF